MAYTQVSDLIGIQPINVTDTVQNNAIGTIVTAYDPVYGVGEFIYLKATTATLLGTVVTYDTYTNAITLPSLSAKGIVAVAMAVNAVNQYGWFQISGATVAKFNVALSINSSIYTSTVAGSITSSPTATWKMDGAYSVSATNVPSAGLCVLQLSRPMLNGNS